MRNFSSTVAISSALQSVSIESLKATMKATRKALSKKTQAKLPLLSEIIDPQSNHRGYSNALQTAATVQERDTCIPWLAVHLKELDRVVRQPLTVLVDDHHLVNFTRYNRFMDRVKEILYYLPPDLEDKRHGGQLTYLLNQLRDIDLSGDLEQQLSAKGEEICAQESSVNNIQNEHLRRVGFAIP
jgi:son of sevenless-like protein